MRDQRVTGGDADSVIIRIGSARAIRPIMEVTSPPVTIVCGKVAAMSPHAWDRYPNLRLGLGGARGNGRLQRQVARAFVGNDYVSTSEVFNWCFPRDRRVSWRRRHRWSVVRVLNQVADRVGRANTPGRPWIWRLR